MMYPAEVLPILPKVAYGTRRMRSNYTGHAIAVANSVSAISTFEFVNDVVDAAALDAHLGGLSGRAVQVYDQMFSAKDISQTLSEAPKIGTLDICGARSVVFEGGSQSGALFSLNFPTLTSLGITAKDYSIYAVIQPSSSMYRNQAFTPGVGIGTIISLENGGGSIVQVLANGGTDTVAGPGRGTFSVRDNSALDFAPTDWMVEPAPIVLAVTSSSAGVSIFQNETFRKTASRSAISSTVTTGYLGKRGTSTAGASSECGDFMLAGLMIYAEGHTPRQRAAVSAALYNHFNIPFGRSKYSAGNVVFMGDSIPAGYVTLGIYGMVPRLQAALPNVRFLNYSVPGAQTTADVGSPFYAYQAGMFPDSILPQLTYSKRKNILVMMGPGNDYARTIPALPADVYAARVSVVQQALAAGVNKVFICTLPPRNVAYQTQITAENILIRAGAAANNYTVIEIANDAQLSINPGPCYADAVHMNAFGHDRAKTVILPQISSALV